MASFLNKYTHFRYKPKRKSYKGCEPCRIFDSFDWVIWGGDGKFLYKSTKLYPSSVLCLAKPNNIKILTHLRFLLKRSVVVIAGEDTNLSEVVDDVELLSKSCKKVYYEAKDIDSKLVDTFSMGFISYYIKRVDEVFLRTMIQKVSQADWEKNGVLASWGAIWSHLDDRLVDRKKAVEFVQQSKWINREELSQEDYWRRLAESKFLLAPAGQGIQAPKLAEAWLMRTVPIVTKNPCFQELADMGYPLLILDEWEDCTKNYIESNENFYQSIDWSKVQYMLTREFFEETYL